MLVFKYCPHLWVQYKEPVRHATFLGLGDWNSDDIKPLQTPLAPASPHGDALLHGASNRRYILIAGSSNRLFFMPQYQQYRTHDRWRFPSWIVSGAVICKEDGGRRSGVTLTDDDAADDSHAGDSGEISHRPWVRLLVTICYLWYNKKIIKQKRFQLFLWIDKRRK